MKPSNPRSAFLNRRTHRLIAFVCAASLSFSPVLLAQQTAPSAPSQDMTDTANAPAQEAAPKIPNDQLDSLVAPIALYPDQLLAQILAASTYPLEVIQLEQWLKRNPNLKDQALADGVAKQPWDPSVQAMAVFPDVVTRLSANVGWTTNLGNAFLAQQQDVMDAVQRMRAKAQSQGALETTEQQKVETETVEGGQEAIVIEPANPQFVYVPSYDPAVAYGQIREAGMAGQVVVYLNKAAQYDRWKKVAPAMPLMSSMPEQIKTTVQFREFLDQAHVAVLDNVYDTALQVVAKEKGVALWLDVEGPDEGPALWDRALAWNVQGLQTDRPAALVDYLRQTGRRQK